MCIQKIIQKLKRLFRKFTTEKTTIRKKTPQKEPFTESNKKSFAGSDSSFNIHHEVISENQVLTPVTTQSEPSHVKIEPKAANNEPTITISDDSFENLRARKLSMAEKYQNPILLEWLKRIPEFHSFDQFVLYLNQFIDVFKQRWPFEKNLKRRFLEFMFQDKRKSNAEYAREYYLQDSTQSGIRFAFIFLLKGYDYSKAILEDFKIYGRIKGKTKLIGDNQRILNAAKQNTLQIKQSGCYCLQKGIYEFRFTYNDKAGDIGKENIAYFLDFDSFCSAIGKNRSNIDLTFAPITSNQLKDCYKDLETRLPLANTSNYSSYKILKEYVSPFGYQVFQQWFDQDGRIILESKRGFASFLEFVQYLDKNLSDGDFRDCNDIQEINKIPGINWEGAKRKEEDALAIGLKIEKEENPYKNSKELQLSLNNEKKTISASGYRDCTYDAINNPCPVFYISDIHLEHRYDACKCRNRDDYQKVLSNIQKQIANPLLFAGGITLIAGDRADSFDLYKTFRNTRPSCNQECFVCLGNHELWSKEFYGKSLNEIAAAYRKVLEEKEWHLVQNNRFYIEDYRIKEITENDLESLSIEDIRLKTKYASIVIFGGIGFAGRNNNFNANVGIYSGTISRDEEIHQSEIFNKLYKKVEKACKDKPVIILTHRPRTDWSDGRPNPNFYYVSGHTHRNYFCNTESCHIFADNQIGYTAKSIERKFFVPNFGFDLFEGYSNGIHKISQLDYIFFYKGRNKQISRNYKVPVIYRLKNNGFYRFLTENTKGELLLLNKGSRLHISHHSLQYFYDHLNIYYQSISDFLNQYQKYRIRIAQKIQSIGGVGYIHGCIINLDYFNHLYINPLDGKITPYFAYSKTEKFVYENLPSLLKGQLEPRYEAYLRQIRGNNKFSKEWDAIVGPNNAISSKTIPVSDTSRYRTSKIIYQLQFSLQYRIIRIWNDKLAETRSSENGKNIVENRLLEDQ